LVRVYFLLYSEHFRTISCSKFVELEQPTVSDIYLNNTVRTVLNVKIK